MLWILLRKELLTNLLTMRLAIVLVFTVVLAVLTVLIGSFDYSSNWEVYAEFIDENDELLEESKVYGQLDGPLRFFVPPEPLSILCRGSTEASALSARFELNTIHPVPSPLGSSNNDRMQTLVQVDFVQAITLLLSFLAVILGFDGICGERERGTMALLLSHPVSRGTVLAAKLAGGMLTLWVPLAIAFCLGLFVLSTNSHVNLAAQDWGRAAVLFLISCLFLGQVYSLALMVSALTRTSATSLIICLFAWLVGGVGYSNALISLSRYGVEETPYPEYQDLRRDLWSRYGKAVEGWQERHPGPDQVYAVGHQVGPILRYARPEYYEWRAQLNGFRLERTVELADESDKVLTPATTGPHIHQALLIEDWALLSPFTNYLAMAKFTTRTSAHDRVLAGEAGRRYHHSIRHYFQERNAFADRRWFTDDPPDQEPMIVDPESVTPDMLGAQAPFMQKRLAWVEKQEEAAEQDPQRKLNLIDFPRFGLSWQQSIGESLAMATPGVLVLVLTFGLSALVSAARLQRLDPRE